MNSTTSPARFKVRLGPPFCTISLAVALCSGSTPKVLGQGTVTFDGLPAQPPGTQYASTYYSEGAIRFRPLQPATYFTRNGGGISGYPEDGTAYLQALAGDALTFDSLRPASFGLISVDLAEYSTLFPYPWTVAFIGHKADGTTVTTSFTTDGIIDGTGPLADFQTFYFDSSFTSLTRVDVPGYGWSMDNLVYSIPEPTILSLLSLTTLALLRWRSRPPPGAASKP